MKKLALILALALAGANMTEGANAAFRPQAYGDVRLSPYWPRKSGPYYQDILQDGTLTGPLAPHANGG